MCENRKKITFVLPGTITVPMGGVKVVNRLADLLSQKKYAATLVYPQNFEFGFIHKIREKIKNYFDKKNNVPQKLYYQPAPEVDAVVVREISEKYIPDADYVVAVGWQTANPVHSLSALKGEKFYFLQSYEAYFSGASKILETYKLNMHKIALSKWIAREIAKLGQKVLGPIGNSINREEFFIEDNIEKNNDVLMLYHPAKIKNAKFGIDVLTSLKKQNSDFTATIFSSRQPVHKIPDWINLKIRPEVNQLRRLYNQSKVYFNTSKWEGWGLTPMEAIACGCAVVAVKNNGITEFLKNNENAFIISPKNKLQAVEKINKLLTNNSLREKFINESHKILDNYSENEIVSRFENCLTQKG